VTTWRRQLAALSVAQVVSALAFSFALPFLPLYVQELGVVDPREAGIWAGLTSATFSIVMATLGPVWGAFADRFGPRLMVGRALFGGALVIGAMGLARQVYDLLALRTLQGAITGVQAAITVLVSAIVPRERLGSSVGLLQMATFGGASFGPLVGGFVADRWGFRAAFGATGALMLVAGAIVFAGTPESTRPPRAAARVGMMAGLRLAVASPSVLSMVLVLFLLQFAATVVSPVLPLFVKELSGEQERVATVTGLVLGLGGFFGALSAVGAGRLADAVGHRGVVIGAALASALLYVPQAWVRTPEQLLAVRVGLGLFTGALIPSTQAVIGLGTPPERRGMAFGIAASAGALGSAAGPLVGAGIAALWGFRAVFYVTGALLLVASLYVAQSQWNVTPKAPGPT
jgi:DHA1 family multidrug resistance protein-like MFS transporter